MLDGVPSSTSVIFLAAFIFKVILAVTPTHNNPQGASTIIIDGFT